MSTYRDILSAWINRRSLEKFSVIDLTRAQTEAIHRDEAALAAAIGYELGWRDGVSQ